MSSVTMASAFASRAGREGADEVFATIISSAGNANAAALSMRLQTTATSTHFAALRRGFITFNPLTYPLPTGYIITAASFKATPGVIPTDDFTQSWCLTSAVLGTPLGNAQNTDYAGTASSRTEYATRLPMVSMVNGTASTWGPMNATGLAYVNAQYLAGNPIVLGLRWSCDIDQASPTWSISKTDDIAFTTAQLVLTYRVGPGHAVLSLTGTLGNAADTVNAKLWVIDVVT